MPALARWALLAAVALGAATQAAAADDKLLAAARSAQPAVIDSLREMVLMESGSQDAAGLKSMADYVEGRLRALGATTERIKAGVGPGEMVRGTFTGTGQRSFMLIAHMDTVYGKGILATEPYRQDGNKLYGPGIADDKGGIAVILHSLAILRDAGWKDYARLTVLINPDEEIGSNGSGELIATLGDAHDVVLSYEPTAAKAVAKDEGVLLMAAGTATARLAVKGVASHAGAAPDQGRNALIELSYQLLQTQDVAKGIPGAQLNWTTATAGSVRNQIPDKAEAGADVRLLAPDAADKLLAALRAKVAEGRRVPDTETTVSMLIGRPPYVAGAKGMALATKAQAIYTELDGRKLLLHPSTGGGTDAGYAGRSGKAAVLESLGLAGWGYHAKNEYIEIDSIVPRLYLTTRLLSDLGAGR
ncbi:MAG: glutamate carboxypeptidase [Rubrivivax sp.]